MQNDCEKLYARQGSVLRRYVYALLPGRGWSCAGNYTNPDDVERRLGQIRRGDCYEDATALRVITSRETREVIDDIQVPTEGGAE